MNMENICKPTYLIVCALVSTLFQQRSFALDVCKGGGSLSQNTPCATLPAFPDFTTLFAGAMISLGPAAFVQLQDDAEKRAAENKEPCSGCARKINVTEFNARLDSLDLVDIDAICPSAATVLPTVTTSTTTVSTNAAILMTTRTNTGDVMKTEQPASVVSTVTVVSKGSSTVSSKSSGTTSPKSDRTRATVSRLTSTIVTKPGGNLQTPKTGQTNEEDIISKATVVTILACVLVIVPVVIIAGVIIIVCFYKARKHPDVLYDVNQDRSTCSSCSSCWGKLISPKPVKAAQNPASNAQSKTHHQPSSNVNRNISVLSSTSTTQLMRSTSQLSDNSSIAGVLPFVDQSVPSTPVYGAKPFQPKLTPLGELSEPASTGRRSDPTHRRTIQPPSADSDRQRQAMLLATLRRSDPQFARPPTMSFSTALEHAAPRVLHYGSDGRLYGNDNVAFQTDSGGVGTGGNEHDDSAIISEYDDDDTEDWMALWEKFDQTENLAAEVEMGSHQIENGSEKSTVVQVAEPPTPTVDGKVPVPQQWTEAI